MVCCFCCITKWVSYIYIHIYPYLLPLASPSHPPYPTPLGGHKAPNWSTCAMWLLPTSYLQLVVYICPCHSLISSQLTLPPPLVLKSILYVCVFIPVLPLGSSEFFFFTGGGISPFYIGLLSHEKENRLLWLGSFVWGMGTVKLHIILAFVWKVVWYKIVFTAVR